MFAGNSFGSVPFGGDEFVAVVAGPAPEVGTRLIVRTSGRRTERWTLSPYRVGC
jgi:hypothetical protein